MCQKVSTIQSNLCGRHHRSFGVLGRFILLSVAIALLTNAAPASANRWQFSHLTHRHLLADNNSTAPAPLNATANGTSTTNGTLSSAPVNATAANITSNATAASSPPPPETKKEKLADKFEKLEAGKTPAERGIAITVGVLMLVCILTCLVCCVFRRGGQWRIPGLQWFKKKFAPKDKYSRYMDNNDDGF